MTKQNKYKNIFADKATLIIRKMIAAPEKKWVVRDFVGTLGLSLGMAQEVLEALAFKGYVERVKKGPKSYTILTQPERLIKDWLIKYNFYLNNVDLYYSSEKDILKKLLKNMNKNTYALTLHTGANLITSYVKTDNIYVYLNLESWDKDIVEIRQKLGLKELVQGGNVYFIKPFYKETVFYNLQTIKGYPVVSNLQLYLDLYNFYQRGKEHADYLKSNIGRAGKNIE